MNDGLIQNPAYTFSRFFFIYFYNFPIIKSAKSIFKPELSMLKAYAIFLFLFLAPTTHANSLCPKPLKAGWETAKPFQFKENDKLQGIDIDTLVLVLESMNCKVVFEEVPWERHLKEVENGTLDIASGASKTPEREKWGLFTAPYSGEAVLLYTLKDNQHKYVFKNERELVKTGIKLGIVAASYLGEEFDNLLREKLLVKNKNLFEFTNEKQLIDLLLANRIDGFLYGGKEVNFHNDIMMHPQKMFEHEAYFLFSKKTTKPAFIEAFNKQLQKLKKEGKVEQIAKKHLSNPKTQY